jgi:putative transposase
MRHFYPQAGVARLCGLFGKSRQALYDAQWRESDELIQEELVVKMIADIRKDLPRIGGVKLYDLLKGKLTEHGMKIGRDGFFKLLRNNNLLVKKKRKYTVTTMSKHHFKRWPNLIQQMSIDQPEQVWVSDITYIRTESGFVYLFLVTDAYSRKIMGYHLSQELKVRGCIIALNKAIGARQYPNNSLIHHSDRGIQYCCDQYISTLLNNKIRISMTQSGSPYDNAIAERINGILKAEFAMDKTFKGYAEAIGPLSESIYAYNNLRPHMSCDYLTPVKAHQQNGKLKKKWKKGSCNVNRQFLQRQQG